METCWRCGKKGECFEYWADSYPTEGDCYIMCKKCILAVKKFIETKRCIQHIKNDIEKKLEEENEKT